jgi:uncharacterized protein (TIRG00374 family)
MRAFKVVAFLLGLFLLVWIIRKIGVEELLTGFRTLGWRLIIPIAIIFPCYLAYTLSWQLFLKRFEHHSIPFWSLFRIKVAGEASNTLTPLNFAGGDPVRIWLLSKNFPVAIGGASVVVDRTLQILAVVSIIFLGNIAALFKMTLPLYAKNLLGITATLLVLLILFVLFHQTRGLFEKLLNLVARLRIRRFSEKTIGKIRELDQHIMEFYRKDRKLFIGCYLLHLFGRLFGMLELLVLARFLGVPMGPWEALFFAAVIPVTNMIGGIVPGTLGVLEGVVSSLFFALHWDPADGVVLQIARRLRSLFWILLGLLFIFLYKSKNSAERKVAWGS